MNNAADGVVSALVFFGILGWIILIVLVILWIILPFAVFGIKKRLDIMIAHLTELHRILDPDGSRLAAFNATRWRAEQLQKQQMQTASVTCPACGKSQKIRDLRPGVPHPCPGCGKEIAIEAPAP